MLYRLIAIQGGKSLPNVSPYVFKAVRPVVLSLPSYNEPSGLIKKKKKKGPKPLTLLLAYC